MSLKSHKFLISFCNNKANNGSRGLLGLITYCPVTQSIEFDSLELNHPIINNPKGVTGLCHQNNQILAVVQGAKPLLVFLNQKFEIESYWQVGELKGIHSIRAHQDHVYFAVTGQDKILKTTDGVKFDVVWETSSNTDTIHLNSICFHQGELFFTAFGKKDGLWSSARSGVIQAVKNNQQLRNDIWHPHSLFSYQSDLAFCNSSNQTIDSINGMLFDQLPGYTRGLYISDEIVVCGTSKGRLISHSTGKKISNISDSGIMAGTCGIWVYNRINDSECFIKLDKYATEIFDVIKLVD